MVDGATSELIPMVSACHRGVGYSSVHPIYQRFELVKNRLYSYADDSTLLTVDHMPADRPALAASRNRDSAKIQEWCNHWCMTLNPNKTKALVISRSRTVNCSRSMVTRSCPEFPFALVPTFTSLT